MSAENPERVEFEISNPNVQEFVDYAVGLRGTVQTIGRQRFVNIKARLASMKQEMAIFIERDGIFRNEVNVGVGFFNEVVTAAHLQSMIGQAYRVTPTVTTLDTNPSSENCDLTIGIELNEEQVQQQLGALLSIKKGLIYPVAAVDCKFLSSDRARSNKPFHLMLQAPMLELRLWGKDTIVGSDGKGNKLSYLDYLHVLTAAIRHKGIIGFNDIIEQSNYQQGMDNLLRQSLARELARATMDWEYPITGKSSKELLERQILKIGMLVDIFKINPVTIGDNQQIYMNEFARVDLPILDFRQVKR